MGPEVGGISLRNICKVFGREPGAHVEAVRRGEGKAELLARTGHVIGLRDVSLDVAAGRIQVIMGLSGSGKSTLIRHINRLIEPTAGDIRVDGKDILSLGARELREFRQRQMAMVFQKFALLPHRTVLGNVGYGLEIRGTSTTERQDIAHRWIHRVGLDGFADKYPNQLSGGMQQRVGLARALATETPILLMDEAFSALDPLIRLDMQSMLIDLQRDIGRTIVFITHDLGEALRLGDRVAILRDGELIQDGAPSDILLRPADPYVESFVREVNRGRVLSVGSLAGPTNGTAAIALAADLTLEAAARRMTDVGADIADIIDAGGNRVGQVDLRGIVAAMVTPAKAA